MTVKKLHTGAAALAAVILGAAVFSGGPVSATAITVPKPIATNSDVQTVSWKYIPSRHGKRFHHKTAKYHFYYGGYWYASPFWLQLGPVTLGLAPRPWTHAWFTYCERKYGHFDRHSGKYRRGGKWIVCR